MNKRKTRNHRKKGEVKDSKQGKVLPAFALFGFVFLEIYTVVLAGTEDILAGTHIPTSTVLLAVVIPLLILDIIAPYFIDRIPSLVLVSISGINIFVGLITMAFAKQVEWRIVAAGLAGSGIAIGTITAMALTSYFESSTVSAYSTGTGLGFLGGPLYYTAMTTWLCVAPSTTLAILSPLSLSVFVSYYFINKNKGKQTWDSTSLNTRSKDIGYKQIEDTNTEEDDETEEGEEEVGEGGGVGGGKRIGGGGIGEIKGGQSNKAKHNEFLTRKQKVLLLAKLFSLTIVPGYIAFFSQYLYIQSLMTTIAYTNSPFRPRDHYEYYFFLFSFGEMIGRSHRSIISLVNPRWLYASSLILHWLLSVTEMSLMLFVFFESWYHFLPGVGVLLFVCFFGGMTMGVLFNNMLGLHHLKFEGKQREFVMGYATLPRGLGMFAAALIGLYVEPRLLEHCSSTFTKTAYCLTRSEAFRKIASTCGAKHP